MLCEPNKISVGQTWPLCSLFFNFCGGSVIFACGEVVTPLYRTGMLVAMSPNPMTWYALPKQILGKGGDKAHRGSVGSERLSSHRCWYGPSGSESSRRRLWIFEFSFCRATAFVSVSRNPAVFLWTLNRHVSLILWSNLASVRTIRLPYLRPLEFGFHLA